MENLQTDDKKKRIKKQNFTALAILVIGTILSFILFGPKNQSEVPVEQSQSAAKMVKTVKISRADSSRATLEKTVKFSSSESGNAVAEYSGRIKQVNFNVGDFVSEGQVLAVFDQADVNNSAKVSLESAQKSLELAEKNLNQTKEIADESVDLAKGAVNIAEIQLKQAEDGGDKDAIDLAEENLEIAQDQKDQAENSAQAQINGARIQVEQARLAVNQAQIGFDKTFIKAPIGGYVVSKNINEEDYVNLGTVVAQIAKEGRLEGKVYLNQNEAARVSKGDSVEIVADGKSYAGRVASISNIANSSNQRFEAVVETDQPLTGKANQSITVKLNLRLENQQGFFVPLEAVNIGQTKNEVFLNKEGKATAVKVELGEIIGRQVEVTEGLHEGDLVIVEGNRNLQEGELVASN